MLLTELTQLKPAVAVVACESGEYHVLYMFDITENNILNSALKEARKQARKQIKADYGLKNGEYATNGSGYTIATFEPLPEHKVIAGDSIWHSLNIQGLEN